MHFFTKSTMLTKNRTTIAVKNSQMNVTSTWRNYPVSSADASVHLHHKQNKVSRIWKSIYANFLKYLLWNYLKMQIRRTHSWR